MGRRPGNVLTLVPAVLDLSAAAVAGTSRFLRLSHSPPGPLLPKLLMLEGEGAWQSGPQRSHVGVKGP